MVQITVYPSVYDPANPDLFLCPDKVLGTHDTLCCCKTVLASAKYLSLSSFKDSAGVPIDIPVGSSIDNYFIGFHARHSVYSSVGFASFEFNGGGGGYTIVALTGLGVLPNCACPASAGSQAQCDLSSNVESPDLQGLLPLSVADWNNQNFTTRIGVVNATGYSGGQFDFVWIRIVYTPPAPPAGGAAGFFPAGLALEFVFLPIRQEEKRRARKRKFAAVASVG